MGHAYSFRMITSELRRQSDERKNRAGERPHNLYLDGVRGIAVLAVLLTHATFLFATTPLTRFILPPVIFGWWGVDLFFVLSGFLITGILLETREAPNRARAFYARRTLRIFPIYYLCLAILWGLCSHSEWVRSMLPYNAAVDKTAYLLYLQNWIPLWHGFVIQPSLLGHFWSLAVEEQFYLIWPWIVWRTSPKLVLRLCVVGVACALLLRVVLVGHFGPHLWIHCLTITRGEGLLIGSALAVLNSAGNRINPKLLIAMASGGASIIVFVILRDPTELSNTDAGPYMYTICVSGLALLFGALVGASQFEVPFLTRGVKTGWLRSFGKYSYGLYVYHIPLFYAINHLIKKLFGSRLPFSTRHALIELALLIGITYGVAWLSFRFIESPLLRLKRYFVARATPERELQLT